jgi:hypothetical protein
LTDFELFGAIGDFEGLNELDLARVLAGVGLGIFSFEEVVDFTAPPVNLIIDVLEELIGVIAILDF